MNAIGNRTLPSRMLAALALLPLLSPAVAPGAIDTGTQDGGPQTHVLFTSTRIQVNHLGALHDVRGVAGDTFLIRVGEKDVPVSMKTRSVELKLAKELTLTQRVANVTDFTHERAYTPVNDPFRKWSGDMSSTQALKERAAIVDYNARNTPQTLETVDLETRETQIIDNPSYSEVSRQLQHANQSISGDMGTSDFFARGMGAEMAKELYDAIRVQFEVSSAEPILSPYIVISAMFHEKDNPKHTQNWVHARTIEPVGTSPQNVSLLEGGFPAGFILDKLDVHLYDAGVEIATDLAEKRAMLTQDEAHEYLVVEYISTHPNDTAPACIAMSQIPEDWAARFTDDSLRKTCYAKVDATGRSQGFYGDVACTIPLSDRLYADFLGSLRFFPALENGKPIDSVARVKLTEKPL